MIHALLCQVGLQPSPEERHPLLHPGDRIAQQSVISRMLSRSTPELPTWSIHAMRLCLPQCTPQVVQMTGTVMPGWLVLGCC